MTAIDGQKISLPWAVVIAILGAIVAGAGSYATFNANLSAAEAKTEEKLDSHERRILDAEKTAKEMLVAIQGIRVDIAGMAADLRNLRQTMDRDHK